MPFLIFFHSMRGLFVEMDSIKQVSSMAAKGVGRRKTHSKNARLKSAKREKLLWNK